MGHALSVKISKERENSGIVTCRQVTVRERLLRFLLGNPIKLTLVVFGDTVEEVGIREVRSSNEPTDKYSKTAN